MFKNFSMKTKILIVSVSSLFVLGGVSLIIYVNDISQDAVDAQVEKSRAIVLNVESVREEMQDKWDLELFTVEMLQRFAARNEFDKILATVPVFSAWNSALNKAEEGNYSFRVPKFQPRNSENQPDAIEGEVIERMRSENLDEVYLIDREMNAIRYFRPVVLSETCLYCHGNPADSEELWGTVDGTDPTGVRMEGWKVGSIHGAFEVVTSLDEADARVRNAILTVLATTGGIIVLIVLITLPVVRSITVPLQKIVALAAEVGLGDLEVTADENRKDEIGRLASSFNEMISSLRDKAKRLQVIAEGDLSVDIELASEKDGLGNSLLLMRNSLSDLLERIRDSIVEVSRGSGEVARASTSMADGATQQSASIEEISSSLTTVSGQARDNATSSGEANSLAQDTIRLGREGNLEMENLSASMSQITDSSEQIRQIAKVIDDIAFQINLLSLNANVEAARAGKHGRGFAVVAEEVRSLAARSAEAAKESSAMVERSVKNIGEGNTRLNRAVERLKEILSATDKVAGLLGEISEASREQSLSIEEITKGLSQIEEVTQANTAAAEEGAAAADELAGQARNLEKLITRFRLSEEQRALEDHRGRNLPSQ